MPTNTLQPSQQDPQTTNESIVRGGDFTNELGTGETITSATVTASWYGGTPDPSPSSILSGGATVSGNQVLQRIKGGVGDALYLLSFVVQTTLSNTFERQAYFRIVPG